jgi:hypothetical protein
MSIKLPYFDRRRTYSASFYTEHEIQAIMALYLSDPSNYVDILTFSMEYREKIFMESFQRFMGKYININYESNFDTFIYFQALNVDTKGSVNLAGGCDTSKSGKRDMIKRYQLEQDNNKLLRKYLSEKYKLDFSSGDPRLFLGHREIWYNPSPDLLKLEGWEWVIEKSYNEIDYQQKKPIPYDMDKVKGSIRLSVLIPLTIRTKVLQDLANDKRKIYEIEEFKREQSKKSSIEIDEFVKPQPKTSTEDNDW